MTTQWTWSPTTSVLPQCGTQFPMPQYQPSHFQQHQCPPLSHWHQPPTCAQGPQHLSLPPTLCTTPGQHRPHSSQPHSPSRPPHTHCICIQLQQRFSPFPAKWKTTQQAPWTRLCPLPPRNRLPQPQLPHQPPPPPPQCEASGARPWQPKPRPSKMGTHTKGQTRALGLTRSGLPKSRLQPVRGQGAARPTRQRTAAEK